MTAPSPRTLPPPCYLLCTASPAPAPCMSLATHASLLVPHLQHRYALPLETAVLIWLACHLATCYVLRAITVSAPIQRPRRAQQLPPARSAAVHLLLCGVDKVPQLLDLPGGIDVLVQLVGDGVPQLAHRQLERGGGPRLRAGGGGMPVACKGRCTAWAERGGGRGVWRLLGASALGLLPRPASRASHLGLQLLACKLKKLLERVLMVLQQARQGAACSDGQLGGGQSNIGRTHSHGAVLHSCPHLVLLLHMLDQLLLRLRCRRGLCRGGLAGFCTAARHGRHIGGDECTAKQSSSRWVAPALTLGMPHRCVQGLGQLFTVHASLPHTHVQKLYKWSGRR